MRIVRQTSGGQPITAFAVAIRREEKQNALAAWHSRLCEEPYVHKRIVEAILPVFKDWMDQKDGRLTYRLTQVITGHGCFGDYLNKIGREATSNCHHCGGTAQDSADHTLAQCPAWDGERRALTGRIGSNLSLPAVVMAMLVGESNWKAVASFCETVMIAKEAAERDRERADPVRRRRRQGGRIHRPGTSA
ncbi:uncharacterized protein LOC115439922 [Manduca sexta]|uniref:uncharacterized protein LOC115439922 n=1 Tax=Manduca sexta TaxID=7130 RepID=UPI00188F3998|nr:uncharacterized protein LOC115439922 [Manduca sexta]